MGESPDLTRRAREACAELRDAARLGRIIEFRQRDPLVMAIHRALDEGEQLRTALEAAGRQLGETTVLWAADRNALEAVTQDLDHERVLLKAMAEGAAQNLEAAEARARRCHGAHNLLIAEQADHAVTRQALQAVTTERDEWKATTELERGYRRAAWTTAQTEINRHAVARADADAEKARADAAEQTFDAMDVLLRRERTDNAALKQALAAAHDGQARLREALEPFIVAATEEVAAVERKGQATRGNYLRDAQRAIPVQAFLDLLAALASLPVAAPRCACPSPEFAYEPHEDACPARPVATPPAFVGSNGLVDEVALDEAATAILTAEADARVQAVRASVAVPAPAPDAGPQDIAQAARLLREWAADRQRIQGQWTAREQAAIECAIRLEAVASPSGWQPIETTIELCRPVAAPPVASQAPPKCANGHVWTHDYGDDWYPFEGTPCDCGARLSGGRCQPSVASQAPNVVPVRDVSS